MDWRKIKLDLMMALGSQLLQKLAGFVVLMVLARHLDKGVMGQFFLAGTLATFLALATELGVNRHLMRGVAQQPDRALGALGHVLALRLPIMLIGYVVLATAVFLLKRELTVPVLLTSLYVLIQDYSYSFSSLMLGLRRVGMRMVTTLIGQVLTVTLVLGAVAIDATLTTVLLGYVAASAVTIVLTVVLVRRKIGQFTLDWRLPEAWQIVKESLPFFLLSVLGVVHFKVDSLMLGILRDYEQVATYDAAYKFLEVSRFVVRPAAMVFFPLCAAVAARRDWPAYERVMRKLLMLSGGIGLATAAFMMLVAGWVVSFVFGDAYGGSVAVLRILYLAVPSVFLGFVATFLAPALHLERRAVQATAICLLVNIALNALVIPRHGAQGAAWATLATETLLAGWLLGLIALRLGALKRGLIFAPMAPGAAQANDSSASMADGEEILDRDATL
jgi:O-antigen/teichoic acid export membrane protein